MSVFALMTHRISIRISLERRQCVQRANNFSAFRIFQIYFDYALADSVSRRLDAAGKRHGISFQYCGFVKLHPFILIVHRRLPSGGLGKGKQERLIADIISAG